MPNREIIDRISSSYVNRCDQFLISPGKFDYEKQYFNIYRARLDAFRPILTERAQNILGLDIVIRKLSDLQEGENCLVIGTIYKQQELKPNILKEIAQEANVLPQPVRASKFTAEDDKLILEDENLRVILIGDVDMNDFVTGVTVGLYGFMAEGGRFNVKKVVYPNLPVQKPARTSFVDDCYVLLLSGLAFGVNNSQNAEQWMRCNMLLDWISGSLGSSEEQQKVSKIARIVIAGNSIDGNLSNKQYGQMARYLTRKATSPTVEAVQNLDSFLEKLAAFVEIDLMPGENDPVNRMMPQQPFHKCMLPKAGRFSTIRNCTNPYMAEIGGKVFLGTSGQNVDDVYKFCNEENRLNLSKANLRWRHLSPSSPDTLGCYPYSDFDPLIISECPQVYFIGNQTEIGFDYHYDYDTTNHENDSKKILVVVLPKFGETGLCALVNIRNMTMEPVKFVFNDEPAIDNDDNHVVDQPMH